MKAVALALLLCPLVAWGENGNSQNSNPTWAPNQASAPGSKAAEPSVVFREAKGQWDFGVWGGGGHTVAGGVQDVGVVNAGVRIGKILTDYHGRGWLRGNLEYAVDLIPMYLFVNAPEKITFLPITCPVGNPGCNQVVSRGTVYAGGFNPFDVKWNFNGTRRVSPYFELNGGVLFSKTELPARTSTVNFVSGATLGMNIFRNPSRAISVEIRYAHISNAGLASPNPGFNTVQAQIGYHWFR